MNASFLLLSVLNVVGASSQGLGPPGPVPTIRAASVCYRVLMQRCGAFGCHGKLRDSDLIQGLRGKCHKSVNSSSFVGNLVKVQFGLRPSAKTSELHLESEIRAAENRD